MSVDRVGLSEEGGYCDLVHVTDQDVTDAKTPTAEQARAIALLELNPSGRPMVRLSLSQWRYVDRVVRALGLLGIPAPRIAADAALAPQAGDGAR